MHRPGVRLFAVLFFLSGMAGLVYEVCWTRLLRLPMGNTVHSLTVVLAAFMAGLALGAWIAGRWVERRGHPLRAYALLEAGIAVACLALPWLVQAETPLFRWAYRAFATNPAMLVAIKCVATGFVILVPATLMGATLPILCRWFVDDVARVGATVGRLYAVNALGAAAGALLAGFVLIPRLGLRGAMYAGVAISAVVAFVAWRASRQFAWRPGDSAARPRSDRRSQSLAQPPSATLAWVVLGGYAVSGLGAMVLQIAWARVLSLVLGSSTYAFSLLVTAFILGLAIGGAVAGRFVDRLRRPALGFAIVQCGIGLSALALTPVFERVPEWMLSAVPQMSQNFGRFQWAQFGFVVAALVLPTACMGACLPLVGRTLVTDSNRAAITVGRAIAWNAAGTIVGAVLGGFVLLPRLGTHGTIVFAAALAFAVGVVVLVLALPGRRGVPIAVGTAAVAVAALVFAPRFDPVVLASGAYLYADAMRQDLGPGRSLRQYLQEQYAVLFDREGLVSHLTVRDGPDGVRSMLMNGKVDASDGSDMATQVLLGHVPALLHPGPREVAVIGLASGVTLGALAQVPGVERLECIEIAPETAAAARFFDHVNHRVLDDPRVHLVFEDGRNHLSLTDRTYDLIVSEPSNPWIAGIASLFTEEFFRACRDRLRPGGVVCVWLQLYGSSLDVVRNVTRTFQQVFPEVTLWETVFGADYLLVGSPDALAVNWDDLIRRLGEPAVAADLAQIRLAGPADFLVHHIASGATLRQWVGDGTIYRDDRNQLEFDAPRLMYRPVSPHDMQRVRELARPHIPDWLKLPSAGLPPTDVAALEAAFRARDTFWRGFVASLQGKKAEGLQAYRSALADNAHIATTVPAYVEGTAAAVHADLLARGDTLAMIQSARELIALAPAALLETRLELARVLGRQPQTVGDAEAQLRVVLGQRPRDPTARLELASLLDRSGRRADAETAVREVLNTRPHHSPALLSLGNYLVERGDLAGGEAQYRAALAIDPGSPIAWFWLASVLHERGQHQDAIDAAQQALRIEPHVRSTRELMALCYRELGRNDEAARILAQ